MPSAPPPPAAPPERAPEAAPPAAAVPVTPAPPPASAPTPARPVGAVPVAGTPLTDSARRTPINPFLANDPNAKAKRLARALVSDLLVYFPQKRDEGLRDGTLKQLFREEIKKSYEEFLEQVGSEFAESTTHFTDALNDILANGQKVFAGPYLG